MVTKARFEPLGDILSPETAWVQASSLLDVAAQFAIKKEDTEALIGIADIYASLGSKLLAASEIEHDQEEEGKPFGFRSSVDDDKELEIE